MRTTLLLSALLAPTSIAAAQIQFPAEPDQKLLPTFSAPFNFGWDIHMDGERAVIGGRTGFAEVFERQPDGLWTPEALLLPPDGVDPSSFGWTVATSGDYALVGAFDADATGINDGAAFVYERTDDGTWTLAAELTRDIVGINLASDFGIALDLQGEVAIVGQPGGESSDPGTPFGFGGEVYVFERSDDGTWPQTAKLTASDAESSADFGTSVAFDDPYLVVGAPNDGSPAFGPPGGGAAYVFERLANGTWVERDKLTSEADNVFGMFGNRVTLSGNILAVQQVTAVPGLPEGSAVEVFELDAGGAWQRMDILRSISSTLGDEFGTALELDGHTILIGSAQARASLHRRAPDGTWPRVIQLSANMTFGAGFAEQGLAHDGGRSLIGQFADDAAGVSAGSVQAYDGATLFHGQQSLSVSAGGLQRLFLRADEAQANRAYVLLGSLSGTQPGTALDMGGALVLPLNFDAYTSLLLATGGAGVLSPIVGLLDASGHADAQLDLPAALTPALAGQTVHHAYAVFDLLAGGAPTLVSNPARLSLVQ